MNPAPNLNTKTAELAKHPLTVKEIEILAYGADGKTSWEISRILGISEHTVSQHFKVAQGKLGASNRTQAVVIADRIQRLATVLS